MVNLNFAKSPETIGHAVESTIYGIQNQSRYYLFLGQVGVDELTKRVDFLLRPIVALAQMAITAMNLVVGRL